MSEQDTELNHLDSEMRIQHRIFESAFQMKGSLVFVYDLNQQKISYSNIKTLQNLGYTAQQIEQAGYPLIFTLIHPDDLPHIYALLQKVTRAADGETREIDYRLKKANDDWGYFRMTVTPFARGEMGKVSEVLASSYDISSRKQTESELRESQRLLQTVLDAIPVRLFWKDANSTFLGCNRLVAQDLGLESPQAIIGLTDYMLAPDKAEKYVADDKAIVTSGVSKLNFEEAQTVAGGKTIWIRTSKVPLRDNKGYVSGVVGIYEDITERRQFEEELEERREQAEAFQQQLKSLHEVSGTLARTTTLEELYRGAVELGKQELGFDRLGLLLLDGDKKNIFGTFGIDTAGNLRDESTSRRSLENDPAALEVVNTKQRVGYWQDVDLWDNWEVVGHGESAMSVLWDQDQPIGWIAIDNLFSHKPIPQNQLELLTLYSSTLGNLIVTKQKEQAQRESEARYREIQQQLIDAQKQALLELSTPIIPLIDRIIIMPLVGSIDTSRAQDITRSLLRGITQHRAHIVIIDITGVPIVDTGVADHLNRTIQAARLKGAHTIVTGISDAVAETIVDLGIDWSKIDTLRDLQSGLKAAFQQIGLRMERVKGG